MSEQTHPLNRKCLKKVTESGNKIWDTKGMGK